MNVRAFKIIDSPAQLNYAVWRNANARNMGRLGATILTKTTAVEITSDGLKIEKNGRTGLLKADTVQFITKIDSFFATDSWPQTIL